MRDNRQQEIGEEIGGTLMKEPIGACWHKEENHVRSVFQNTISIQNINQLYLYLNIVQDNQKSSNMHFFVEHVNW
jgi:transposase